MCNRCIIILHYEFSLGSILNKKVLLQERKRHTGRRVGSARYAALSNGWGGGGGNKGNLSHPYISN